MQEDNCSEETQEGMVLNKCEDKPVITYCEKCNRVYAVNWNTGNRTELNMTVQELIEFIREKEINGNGY